MAEKKKNPTVFLDISTGYNAPAERIVIELFSDVVPETAENFRSLCVGAKSKSTGKQLCYKGSQFHRIVKGFMAQGGDVCNGDGSGCESIYGGVFRDEGFKLLHDRRGLLSMANCGQNTNGCQFFITFNAAKHLNGIHVVFGEVLEGMESLNRIEHAGSEDGKPTCPVTIVECGEVHKSEAHEAVITEKERRKIRKSGKASHPNDSSDEEGRGRHKKSLKDKKKKRKRRYSSSDSCTSDDEEGRGRHKKSLKDKKKKRKRRYSSSDSCTSDNSGSDSFSSSCSDSDSDSDSSSSDASCRKKEMSKRARHTRGRKRRDVRKEKQRVRHNKKSKHKSKWSSESSSGSEWQ